MNITIQKLIRFLGLGLFVGMMAAGYYYNLTFVQLGLEDFGTRILGLSAQAVARDMALLALLTCLIAVSSGWWMQQRGWGRRFRLKLRLSFGVVLLQSLLTLVCPLVNSEAWFMIWLAGVSLALGIGVPVMFSMTIDLAPVRMRGGAAALVTAAAYFAAEMLSSEWTFDAFRSQSLVMLAAGTIGMGLLAFIEHPWLDALGQQHTLPEFGRGRFLRQGHIDRRLVGLIVAMFGIYFVDSLGFLRLLKTPLYMTNAWQSPDFDVRLFIAGTHVVGALVAGVRYCRCR